MRARRLILAGFSLAFAALGLGTGESRAARILGLLAAAASGTCFALAHRQEKP